MKTANHIFKDIVLLLLLSLLISSCLQKEEKGFKPEFVIDNYGVSITDKKIGSFTEFPCGGESQVGSCAGYIENVNIKFDSTAICVVGKIIYFKGSFNDTLYKFIEKENWKRIPELTILDNSIITIKMLDSIPTNYSTDGEYIYYFEQKIDANKTKAFITVNEELLFTKNKIYSKGKPLDRKIISFPIYFFEKRIPE